MSFRLRNNGPVWLGEFTALTEAGFSNGCSCRLHGASKYCAGRIQPGAACGR